MTLTEETCMSNCYLNYFTYLRNLCIILFQRRTQGTCIYIILSSSLPDRTHRFLFLPYHSPDTFSPSLLPRQSPISPRRSWSFPNPTRPVPSTLDSPHLQSSFPKSNPASSFSPKQFPSLIFLPQTQPREYFQPQTVPNRSCSFPKHNPGSSNSPSQPQLFLFLP